MNLLTRSQICSNMYRAADNRQESTSSLSVIRSKLDLDGGGAGEGTGDGGVDISIAAVIVTIIVRTAVALGAGAITDLHIVTITPF